MFSISRLIIKNVHHSLHGSKMMSSYILFYLIKSPKLKDIPFVIMEDKQNQQYSHKELEQGL